MTRSYFFRSFRRFYRFKRWLRPRVSPGGKLLVGTLIAAGVFGVDVRKSFAFQVFALALGLLVAAVIGAAMTRGRFRVRRTLPRFVTRGERFVYRAEITNLSRRRQAGVLLQEVVQVRLPTFEEFHRLREPGYGRRNPFDRHMGYPRWVWVMSLREGVSAPEQPLPPLEVGETVRVELELIAHRRGQVSLSGARVLCPDPLGLFRRVIDVSAPGTVLVLPKVVPMPRFELGRGRRRPTSGVVDRRSAGGAEDFKGLREYRPGDGLRHIDWRASARLQEPVVKEFNRERRGGVAVFLDTEEEPYSERFEAAVSVAASVLAVCPAPTELVLLRPPPARRRPAGVRAGVAGAEQGADLVRAHGRERAMMVLASVQARELGSAAQALALGRTGFPDAVVAVFSRFDAHRAALLEVLRARAEGEVLALVMVEEGDPPDLALPALAMPVRIDAIAIDLRRFAEAQKRPGRRAA